MDSNLDRKHFLWGALLAWAPWVPTIITLGYFLWGTKATGLAVVAGGIIEMLVFWGIITLIITQLAAIVWLLRSFSHDHIIRNLVSAASICMSALMLIFVAASAWMVWFRVYRQ